MADPIKFAVASNGKVHVEGCVHARSIKFTSGGFESIEEAKKMARDEDFYTGIAPCAKAAQ